MENKSAPRHYEIDALRVIALVLLIIYHIFACYQPFANMLQFLQYDELLEKYWFIGELLNIWRIPVLFVISGMAVGFVMRRRTVKEVFVDRMIRLVPPLLFCTFVIYPFFPALYAIYHGKSPTYQPHPGHLWFVQSLVSYTILMLPLIMVVKKWPENSLVRAIRWSLPVGLLVILPLPLMLETALFKPEGFAFFPLRFWYGLICYGVGFLLLSTGEKFWNSIRVICHVALPLAILFYLGRMNYIDWQPIKANHWTTAFESGMWMLAFLGYGSVLLNRPSRFISYMNKAVFPIYIIHMPVQQAVAFFLYRLKLAPELTFGLHVLITLALCWLIYELVIRRIRFLYPVMGLKGTKAGEPVKAGGLAKFGTALTVFVLSPLVFLTQAGTLLAMSAVQFSAEHKPDVTKSDSLWVAAKNNDVDKLGEFLKAGKNPVNQPDPVLKLPALNYAALNGSTEAVELLIKAGADVNARTEDGSTAVSHAAFMGHPEAVAVLIEHGAELNTVNKYKATPLDSSNADWKHAIGAAKFLGLTVVREQWEQGRVKARELLKKNGGKHKSELK